MTNKPNTQIKFYNSSNIPLPALTEKADTQELKDELLIRRLNHAFNRGIEHERNETNNMPMNEASHAFCKMIQDDKPEVEYVDVTIRLPKPPDGWEIESVPRVPNEGEWYYSPTFRGWKEWTQLGFEDVYICCRRVWTPPANAVGTFYPSNVWRFTDGAVKIDREGDWYPLLGSVQAATVFSDFATPPERRPYKVDRGVVVKDGERWC